MGTDPAPVSVSTLAAPSAAKRWWMGTALRFLVRDARGVAIATCKRRAVQKKKKKKVGYPFGHPTFRSLSGEPLEILADLLESRLLDLGEPVVQSALRKGELLVSGELLVLRHLLRRELLATEEIVQGAPLVVRHSSDVAGSGGDRRALVGHAGDRRGAHRALGGELRLHLLRTEVAAVVVADEARDGDDDLVAGLRLAGRQDEALGVEGTFGGERHRDRLHLVGGWDGRRRRLDLGADLARDGLDLGDHRGGRLQVARQGLGGIAREEKGQSGGQVVVHRVASCPWRQPFGGWDRLARGGRGSARRLLLAHRVPTCRISSLYPTFCGPGSAISRFCATYLGSQCSF